MDKHTTRLPPGHINPELAYLRGEVETAGPLKLLLLLYGRLIRELRDIRDRMGTKATGDDGGSLPVDITSKFERCRNILQYLINSINPEAGDVAKQLTSMYFYFYQQILTAQMEKDGRIIDEILPNLETIQEGWAGIAAGDEEA